MAEAARGGSFLAHVGTVAKAVVKHVPGRGALWAVIGFVLGWVWVAGSFVVNLFLLGRGAELAFYLLPLAAALPVAGGAYFGAYGLRRGAARAALELERKFGLVAHVVGHVVRKVEARVGPVARDLPLGDLERILKDAVDAYVVSDAWREGGGVTGWVVRRAKRSIVRRIDTYLLAAYRAEDGRSGVSLERVGARAGEALSGKLGDVVLGPLSKELWIAMVLYAVVGLFWLPLLFLLLAALGFGR